MSDTDYSIDYIKRMNSMRHERWLALIKECAEKVKDKLTQEEFADILFTGDATGDGRLSSEEIHTLLDSIPFKKDI